MNRRSIVLAIALGVVALAGTRSTTFAMPAESPSDQAAPYGVSAFGYVTLGWHIVQPGETIFCIARAYQVDPWAIAYYNGIANPNLIQPYTWLAIPNAYTWLPAGPTCTPQFHVPGPTPGGCTCRTYHTVQWGQTLYSIGAWYGVSANRIAQCNGIYDINRIQAGSTLCIPTW